MGYCCPSALERAVEKFMPCLITGERAVRTVVRAVVSAADIRAFFMISRVVGSVVWWGIWGAPFG